MITLAILLYLLYAKHDMLEKSKQILVVMPPDTHTVLRNRITAKGNFPGVGDATDKKEEILRELKTGKYRKITRICIKAEGYVPHRNLRICTDAGLVIFDSAQMLSERTRLMGNGVTYKQAYNKKQTSELSEFTLEFKPVKIDNERHKIIIGESDAMAILMAALSKERFFEDLEIIIVIK